MNGEKPPSVNHVLELERQMRAQDEWKHRLATTPTNVTPQAVDRFSIAVVQGHAVVVLARHGAVMADGTFNAAAVAPFAAVSLQPEVLKAVHAGLGQAIQHLEQEQKAAPPSGPRLVS